MSVVQKNWQTTRPTIRERSKFMFNNDLFSDVKFVVRKTDGESKQVIPAHKFVLSISSPVFEAMFYGGLAGTKDSIELPDCDYESLLELFRYIYSDEVILSGSNVMGVLYLAKKYIVPSLADKCTEYLRDNLDPSNVFSILPSAQTYEDKDLVDRCWKVVDENAVEAVKSEGFATIERSLLEALVIRDTLTIEEIELFKAVDLWAKRECERQGLAAEGAAKRRILGEEIIKGIRFSLIKQEDFAGAVLDSEILIEEEIVKRFSSNCLAGFSPEIKRLGGDFERCCRFGSVTSWHGYSYDSSVNCINLSVDKDVTLLGMCLFGSGQNSYSIDLKVEEDKRKVVCKSGQFFSEPFQSTLGSYGSVMMV